MYSTDLSNTQWQYVKKTLNLQERKRKYDEAVLAEENEKLAKKQKALENAQKTIEAKKKQLEKLKKELE